MPGCIVSAMTASFRSVEKRRRRATPVITSIFENVSDIGVCLGLYLGPPAKAGVRSKRGAVHSGFEPNHTPQVSHSDSGKTGVAAEGMAQRRFLVEDRFRGTVTYYDGED